MKIRIKGNSLRYRLTRSEVDRLAHTGRLEERIDFGESSLTYALHSTQHESLSASFKDNQITVFLPASMIDEWLTTDRCGFEQLMPLKDRGSDRLTLLVEKDYTCLDNTSEDQSDNYPNPLLKTSA